MNFRYRVKGRVEKSFILRGILFRIGAEVDNYITEQELGFVQEHCVLTEVFDAQSQANATKPIPKNSTNIEGGIKDDAKSASRTNKVKPAPKV